MKKEENKINDEVEEIQLIDARELSGIYLEVFIDGKKQAVCFEDLPVEMQKEQLKDREVEWTRELAVILLDIILTIVKVAAKSVPEEYREEAKLKAIPVILALNAKKAIVKEEDLETSKDTCLKYANKLVRLAQEFDIYKN